MRAGGVSAPPAGPNGGQFEPDDGLRMRRLIPYGLGVALFAGAEYLFLYVMYVYVLCGSLACVPYGFLANHQLTGRDILLSNYFMEMLGAVGGLLGLAVAALLDLRHGWGLSLAQGIIAMLAPSAGRSLLRYPSVPDVAILVTDIAILVSAGAIGALLALDFYIAAVRSCVG
jgi:hypothetical protein